jgi:Fic family protein
MKDLLKHIEQNKATIEAHGKLDPEVIKKVNYKFRLDWNYHSNRMEGGTLTMAETRSVMVGNIDVKGKPISDVLEMNGHDEVVRDLFTMAKGEKRLSETRIKSIHKAILAKGNKNCSDAEIGDWKKNDNHIINYKGEKEEFTSFADVPEAVHAVLNDLNASLDHYFDEKKSAKHPLEIVAQFHLDFIKVHPFCDGNGRVTRILVNLILMSCGYLPVIIKTEQREAYFNLLADIQNYGGNTDLFIAFLAERQLESQEIYLKAINGESIEEEDDLDKRLQLLDQQFESISEGNDIKQILTSEYLLGLIEENGWLRILLIELLPIIKQFSKYYVKENHTIFVDGSGIKLLNDDHISLRVSEYLDECIKSRSDGNLFSFNVKIDLIFEKLKKSGLEPIDLKYVIEIKFDETSYSIFYSKKIPKDYKSEEDLYTKKLLSNNLQLNEIKEVVRLVKLNITNALEADIERINKYL